VKILEELALLYKRTGNVPEVLNCYKKALQIAPDNAVLHNSLGAVYAEYGRTKDSIESLQEAVRLAPKNSTYRNNLGNSLYRASRIAEARESYKIAFDLKPDFLFALSQGLHASRQLCDWSKLDEELAIVHNAVAARYFTGRKQNLC
jgi:tetratricopeptide (TPR) repeat protein